MAAIKAYTDLQQSKKLAEILPPESADMCWTPFDEKWDAYLGAPNPDAIKKEIPCWSLAALLGVASTYCGRLEITLRADKNYNIFAVSGDIVFRSFDDHPNGFDNTVDACYELIVKLHELKMS